MTARFWFITALIALAAFSRLMPHPDNFAPITAVALFAGALVRDKRLAFLVPLLAMLASDLIIGFYPEMWVTYVGFAAAVCFGFFLQRRWKQPVTLLLTTVSASLTFFVLTNFVGWSCYDMYPKTLAGLMESYAAALPFLRSSLAGDIIYTGLLFGSFALAQKKYPALNEA